MEEFVTIILFREDPFLRWRAMNQRMKEVEEEDELKEGREGGELLMDYQAG